MQLAMFDAPPRARSHDPSTSHAAAASARELQADHHAVILAALREFGPSGKDRIASFCRLTGVAVARRTVELQRAGLIVTTGRNVTSTSGRSERQWAIAS